MGYGLLVRGPDNSIMYDMGDYSTRYVGTVDITLPAGQTNVWVGWGVDETNYFATIVQALDSVSIQTGFTELVAIANNGSVQVTALTGPEFYERIVRVDIYKIS